MKRLFYSVPMIVALLLASCTKEMRFHEPPLADGDKVPVALTCEPLDFELEEGTKSHLGNNILTKVSNVNYYLFDKEGNFVSQGYTEDLGEFGIALPDIDAHYQCFFFANVGRFAIPETTKASEMGTAVHYDFQSYDNYSSSVNGYGFPMAAGVADFNKVNAGNVTVKRLVHTLRVKINTAALNASQLTVKNVRVRQAPRDFFPFAEKSKLTEQFDDQDILETGADWLSAEEVEKINNGEEVRLYILENMRGELIPGNTEWKNKTPQNVRPLSEANLATYIEIETSVVTPTANYENVVYRAYLGKSPSNFDVQRSTSFLLTNVFTSDMIPDEDWRIDPGTPVVTGSLKFVMPMKNNLGLLPSGYYDHNPSYLSSVEEDHCPTCGGNNYTITGDSGLCNDCGYYGSASSFKGLSGYSFYLTDNFEQNFFIEKSNGNIKYNVTLSKSKDIRPYLDYKLTKFSYKYDLLTIYSTKKETYQDAVDEYGFNYLSNGDRTGVLYNKNTPQKIYPVDIIITSEDGLVSNQITCNYFYGKIGTKFSFNSLGYLDMQQGNVLGLRSVVEYAGGVSAYIPGRDKYTKVKPANSDYFESDAYKNGSDPNSYFAISPVHREDKNTVAIGVAALGQYTAVTLGGAALASLATGGAAVAAYVGAWVFSFASTLATAAWLEFTGKEPEYSSSFMRVPFHDKHLITGEASMLTLDTTCGSAFGSQNGNSIRNRWITNYFNIYGKNGFFVKNNINNGYPEVAPSANAAYTIANHCWLSESGESDLDAIPYGLDIAINISLANLNRPNYDNVGLFYTGLSDSEISSLTDEEKWNLTKDLFLVNSDINSASTFYLQDLYKYELLEFNGLGRRTRTEYVPASKSALAKCCILLGRDINVQDNQSLMLLLGLGGSTGGTHLTYNPNMAQYLVNETITSGYNTGYCTLMKVSNVTYWRERKVDDWNNPYVVSVGIWDSCHTASEDRTWHEIVITTLAKDYNNNFQATSDAHNNKLKGYHYGSLKSVLPSDPMYHPWIITSNTCYNVEDFMY